MDNNKGSFQEKLGEWADKAGDYVDTIRSKTNQYADKIEDMAGKVSKKTETGADRLNNQVRSSVSDLKNSAAEYTDRMKEQKTEVADRTREFDNRAKDSIRDVKDESHIVRRDAQINKAVIQRRADRFTEGVEKVSDDLNREQNRPMAQRRNHTSPIDAHGDYRAVDGTVNNLDQRLDEHTRKTKERMREDAQGIGVGTFSHKK